MISTETYQTIADDLSIGQDEGLLIKFYLVEMLNILDASEVSDTNRAKSNLKYEITNVYNKANIYHNDINTDVIEFMAKLQSHVLNYYNTIDDFLQEKGIMVYCTFARISLAAGFPISLDYIRDAEYCDLNVFGD